MEQRQIQSDLARRFNERHDARVARSQALAKLLAGEKVDPQEIEPADRQAERATLMNRPDIAAGVGQDPNASKKLFEAIIGQDDTLPRRFLGLGEIAARAVGRIVVQTPGAGKYGTGALISRNLILTNNHVLESADVAANSLIQFGYYEDLNGQPASAQSFALRPDDFFFTNEGLDFTIVSVETQSGGTSTDAYGYLELLPPSGKALVGEKVNIVQHAGAQPQTISIRQNEVVDVFDLYVHYTADTAPGSSGAPVFNDSWQLVALHHASVPATSSQGDSYVVNEGVRISSIVDFLRQNMSNGSH